MNNECQLVIFSDKAYNAIIRETFEWEPVETGGILLGHILDNGCWLVMEVLPPGYGEGREGDNVHHEYGYFEYNQRFVNYLAKSVAEQYEIPLELLGLWHRHPGSMDVFSGTDDVTNSKFAQQNPNGVISGLINVDPQLRMTMYHLANKDASGFGRPPYQRVETEVIGSEDIPEEYRRLRYYDGTEKSLHPYAPNDSKKGGKGSRYDGVSETPTPGSSEGKNSGTSVENGQNVQNWLDSIKKKPQLTIICVVAVCLLLSLIPLRKNIKQIVGAFKKPSQTQVIESPLPKEKEQNRETLPTNSTQENQQTTNQTDVESADNVSNND